MNRSSLLATVFFLSLFSAGALLYGAELRTVGGKTSQGDAFQVEIDKAVNKKSSFVLVFTEMSDTISDFFAKIEKHPDAEITVSFLDNDKSLVTKVRCPIGDFKYSGGLSYRGEIPCDSDCTSIRAAEVSYTN